MQKLWRIKDLLEWTAGYFAEKGLASSRLEADILLAHALQKDRVYLYANYERPVDAEERELFRKSIRRRVKGEPIAYITGHKEFMSLDFMVTSAVLIPRPDTEVLVETALEIAREEGMRWICDVGTGSGAIAVSLAKLLGETVSVYAVDISWEALEIARQNAAFHGTCIDFSQGDLLAGFPAEQKIDLIIANLPYVPREVWAELDPGVRDFEPELALVAAGDGLELYRRLLPQVQDILRPGGTLLLEIDPGQAGAAQAMMQGFEEIMMIQDFAGRDRVVRGRRKLDE